MRVVDYMKFASVLFQQPVGIEGPSIRSKLTQQDIDYMQKVAKHQFEIIMNTLKEMPRCLLFVTWVHCSYLTNLIINIFDYFLLGAT